MVPMRYKLLGDSGLRVSELALGSMTFGRNEPWGCSKTVAKTIYDAYRTVGGNLIDTASFFASGESEACLSDFIANDRDAVVLTTKCAYGPPSKNPNAAGTHRKYMFKAVETSLQRLGTDYIDLLWLNGWDFMTPEHEVMRSLEDLLRAGKVLYIGITDAPAWIISRCNLIAELKGWTSFIALQAQYNLVERSIEREILPMARATDLGVVACSPLAGGFLSGKYADGKAKGRLVYDDLNNFKERNRHQINVALGNIAAEADCQPAQVALAWIRNHNVIPIIGARTYQQIQDNLGVLEVSLTAQQMELLDEVSQIELGYPHEYLCKTRSVTYAGMFEKIDQHRNRGSGVF